MMVNDTNIKDLLKRKIEEYDFLVDQKNNYIVVCLDNNRYKLCNNEVHNITGKTIVEIEECYGECYGKHFSIHRRIGLNPKEFFDKYQCCDGYRLCRDNEGYIPGKIKSDVEDGYGLFFTINAADVFYFILANHRENFGNNIARISLKRPDGSFLEDANIIEACRDTNDTFRTSQFYISDCTSLNNYDLINHYYNITTKRNTVHIGDEVIYNRSIKHYEKQGLFETVRALIDIHNEYMKNPLTDPLQWY